MFVLKVGVADMVRVAMEDWLEVAFTFWKAWKWSDARRKPSDDGAQVLKSERRIKCL